MPFKESSISVGASMFELNLGVMRAEVALMIVEQVRETGGVVAVTKQRGGLRSPTVLLVTVANNYNMTAVKNNVLSRAQEIERLWKT